MRKGDTTKLRLDPKKLPKTDWRAFDALTDKERRAAAVADPDCPPAKKSQLARARRNPDVRAVRLGLKLTQEEFAERFGLPLGTVRDWEQGAHRPDRAAQVLIRVIARDPQAVIRALKEKSAA